VPDRQEQADDLAVAGAVHGRGGRWAAARRNAAGPEETTAGGEDRASAQMQSNDSTDPSEAEVYRWGIEPGGGESFV
jgi:hypothetical protein